MTLVRDIYADFPDLASPSGLFVAGSDDYLPVTASSETVVQEDCRTQVDIEPGIYTSTEKEELLDDVIVAEVAATLDELEQLAYEVRMMSAPTPLTLSPVTPQEGTFASWQHVIEVVRWSLVYLAFYTS